VAAADYASTNEDTPVTISVLANDGDADGDTLSVASFTQPSHGTVAGNGNGTLTYTPAADYNGPDGFSYTISDGRGGTAGAVVGITVSPVNDAPAAVPDAAATNEDTPLTVSPLLNDSDPDGDTLSVASFTQAAHGTVAGGAGGKLTYTPAANYNGPDSFSYTISDGQGGTANGIVNVTVLPVKDSPVAVGDAAATTTDAKVVISPLANDRDPDGDTLSIAGFTQPSHGAVAGSSGGTLTYTPAAGFNGLDSFSYTISDGQGGQATATISIAINAAPAGPTLWTGLGGYYAIDRDGDGYGVACSLGPDADDLDPSVTTFASALSKYASAEALLNHLGYYPTRIIYVSKSGNNSTGQVGDINKPFASYTSAPGGIKPGDVVIYREGVWQGSYTFNVTKVNGTPDRPIVFMAMPGERVVFDATDQSIEVGYSSNVVIDGFICTNTKSYYGKGVGFKYTSNAIFRNIESSRHTWGMLANNDLHNIIVEYCVFRDNPSEHGIYLCGDSYPDSDLIVRNNIMYGNGRHGFQFNGRVTNLLVEDNIIHSNNMGGISLLMGVQNSVFRDNLIFNNNKQGIILYNYDDPNPSYAAYDQTNNLFENNIIWVGKYSWNGQTQPASYAAILVNDVTKAQARDLGHNTFRNNIIVTYSGEAFRFSRKSFADTTTIEGNLIYRVSGDSAVMYVAGTTYSFAGFKSYSPLISNNTFAKPNFADVSIDYRLTPWKFDFRIVG
jgi:hypothetical protein